MSQQEDMDLLLWLHAEAVWQRDVAHRIVERMETGHVEFGGPDGERIHPDWCRECRVQALKDAIADIDRHATPIGLLDENDPEGSPHHYVVTVGALHRALGKAYTAEPCESERERLRTELDRAEASRRDWAAEAEAVARRYQDVLGAIWLYVDWRYVTKQLTTEQKTLWADAVDAFGEEADSGGKADRWWERLPCGHTRAEAERSIRHELCAVHPEADRAGEVDRV